MRVVHKLDKMALAAQGPDNFLLSNGLGGFASLSAEPISKFQGVGFFAAPNYFKVIDSIAPEGADAPTELRQLFWAAERARGRVVESFFMPGLHNAFVYELSEPGSVLIDLDCRKLFDFREFGRHYHINEEAADRLTVHYIKKTDRAEDATHGQLEYELWCAIIADKFDYDRLGEWLCRRYPYDSARKSAAERHVYRALRFKGTRKVIFGFGKTKEAALAEAEFVAKALEALKAARQAELRVYRTKKLIGHRKLWFGYAAAQNCLAKLVAELDKEPVILAGSYWFAEHWLRDETISCKALIQLGEFELAKRILFWQLGQLKPDGRLPCKIPACPIESADVPGWLFARFGDLVDGLIRTGKLKRVLSQRELLQIKHGVEKARSLAWRAAQKSGSS